MDKVDNCLEYILAIDTLEYLCRELESKELWTLLTQAESSKASFMKLLELYRYFLKD
jgi:hypothetical protein